MVLLERSLAVGKACPGKRAGLGKCFFFLKSEEDKKANDAPEYSTTSVWASKSEEANKPRPAPGRVDWATKQWLEEEAFVEDVEDGLAMLVFRCAVLVAFCSLEKRKAGRESFFGIMERGSCATLLCVAA